MRGGKREGAGRPKGSVNKATADVKAAAQRYTSDAIETLAQIMRTSESDAAKVAASNSILDRAYGKPAQAHIGGDENDPAIRVITEIRRSIVDPRPE